MRKIAAISLILLLAVFSLPTLTGTVSATIHLVSHASVDPQLTLLDQSFSPLVGGLPFCFSGSRGSLICYTPSFYRTAYNIPSSLDGSGQTIVIVDAFGSPTLQADLDTYSNTFGLPTTTITVLCGPTWTGAASDSCPPFDPSLPIQQACGSPGWWGETNLDVAMSHGLAPGAHIVLVVSDDCQDSSFNAAEGAVVAQPLYHGAIMSQSFGEPDDLVGCLNFPCTIIDHSIKQTADRIYNQARRNGWTVLASSGDDGANEAARFTGTTELTPSWPATTPLTIAAGGTQGNPYGGQYGAPPGKGLTNTCDAGATCNTGIVVINGGDTGCSTAPRPGLPTSCFATGYGGEATWNEFATFHGLGRVSGGGVSSLYGRPTYQISMPPKWATILGDTAKGNGRLTPDISFDSAAQGGFLSWIGFAGAWGVFSGTSAASPALAAIVALLNQAHGSPVGFLNSAIYQLAASSSYSSDFHDVTVGNNSDTNGKFGFDGFAAGPGYDLATGWGSPNVANFIADISAICTPACPGP